LSFSFFLCQMLIYWLWASAYSDVDEICYSI